MGTHNRRMVTLLRRAKTADVKTADDRVAWTAMIVERMRWQARPEVAAALAAPDTDKGELPLVPGGSAG